MFTVVESIGKEARARKRENGAKRVTFPLTIAIDA
jgi:hypothetical protein